MYRDYDLDWVLVGRVGRLYFIVFAQLVAHKWLINFFLYNIRRCATDVLKQAACYRNILSNKLYKAGVNCAPGRCVLPTLLIRGVDFPESVNIFALKSQK